MRNAAERRADLVDVRPPRRRRGVRIAGRRARDRVEHGRGVADRSRQHELVGERAPVLAEVGPEGGAGPRRLQPDDAAHRSRGSGSIRPCRCRARPARARPRPRRPIRHSTRRCCASSSHGLCVGPYASGSVVTLVASSGVLVLPTKTNPAARKRAASHVSSRSVQPASFSACMPAWNGSPAVWHTASLTRNGTPANGAVSEVALRGLGAGAFEAAVDHRVQPAVDLLDAGDGGVDELAAPTARRARRARPARLRRGRRDRRSRARSVGGASGERPARLRP